MLFDANSFDKALAEYQKILATNPDDTDALVKSGMLLFNIGAVNNDKAKYQEAANYLQQFVDKAPDTDRLKADAKAILEELKNQQNVKAEKTADAGPSPSALDDELDSFDKPHPVLNCGAAFPSLLSHFDQPPTRPPSIHSHANTSLNRK